MSTNLMEERLNTVLSRLHTELDQIEERRTDLRRQISQFEFIRSGGDEGSAELLRTVRDGKTKTKKTMSAEGRERISAAQKARHAKNGNGNKNATSPQWSAGDDKVIINMIRSKGKVEAPDISRVLAKKLPHRTEGAIRQHISRLAVKGVLKQTMNGNSERGGIPHMLVEAV